MNSPHRSVEELLHHMPAVHHAADSSWAKGFAASIVKQSRRRNWNPSPKQVALMRRLVSDLFAHVSSPGGDDFRVIED